MQCQHSSVYRGRKNGQKYQVKTDLGDNQCPLAEKPTWLSQIKGDPLESLTASVNNFRYARQYKTKAFQAHFHTCLVIPLS